jgi:hypothetical protein
MKTVSNYPSVCVQRFANGHVIAISPDGNHLYISGYCEDTVMTLSIVPVEPIV